MDKVLKVQRRSLGKVITLIAQEHMAYFKGSQLGAFSPKAIVYCYHEFKLRYLKNQKLFSIRVKELFDPIVLQKKKKKKKKKEKKRKRRWVFALFKSIFLEKPIFEWR